MMARVEETIQRIRYYCVVCYDVAVWHSKLSGRDYCAECANKVEEELVLVMPSIEEDA